MRLEACHRGVGNRLRGSRLVRPLDAGNDALVRRAGGSLRGVTQVGDWAVRRPVARAAGLSSSRTTTTPTSRHLRGRARAEAIGTRMCRRTEAAIVAPSHVVACSSRCGWRPARDNTRQLCRIAPFLRFRRTVIDPPSADVQATRRMLAALGERASHSGAARLAVGGTRPTSPGSVVGANHVSGPVTWCRARRRWCPAHEISSCRAIALCACTKPRRGRGETFARTHPA